MIGSEVFSELFFDFFSLSPHPSGLLLFQLGVTPLSEASKRNHVQVLRLLLDCDAGTLTVKKNGTLLGVAVAGFAGVGKIFRVYHGPRGPSRI